MMPICAMAGSRLRNSRINISSIWRHQQIGIFLLQDQIHDRMAAVMILGWLLPT